MKNKISSPIQKFNTFITLIFFSFVFLNVEPAKAEFNNLTPCKESPAFEKRLNSSVKKLENR